MSRYLLVIIVVIASVGAVFFGYELVREQEAVYSPEVIFGTEDEGVLLINRYDEIYRYKTLTNSIKNPISKELSAALVDSSYSLKTYISTQRPVVVFQKESRWKKEEVADFQKQFKDARTQVDAEGNFLVAYQEELHPLNGFSKGFFIYGDKKASGSIWRYRTSYEDWVRTDIYGLDNGLFKYQTARKYHSHGTPISEANTFSKVLPENIQNYTFFERFYAADQDSVFAKGLMNEWVDKGYVKATFNNEVFLVTDNRIQQTPALILLEKSVNEDAIDYTSSIKSFIGFQLTTEFPVNPEKQIYLLELEDKTIITETLDLAKKIQLLYSLGETISLNTKKSEQFFGDLPRRVNYRYIDKTIKKSITVSDKIIFEVSTLPPGEAMIMQQVSNWATNLTFSKIEGVKPIKDHIRGGISLFIFSKEGAYELISSNGETIFNGTLDTCIIGKVSVVDLYSNDKKQLLFTTPKGLNLLDLKGNQVGHFPYKPHHTVTSPPSFFTWKGTMRFLIGTSNGELITVNNSGQELEAVQATQGAIVEKPFALNINSQLRGWFKNTSNLIGLAYIEKPIASEVLGRSKGDFFQKNNGAVEGWYSEENNVYKEVHTDLKNNTLLGEGKLIKVTEDHVIIQKSNELFIYALNGNLLRSQKLPFNEVGDASLLYFNGVTYLGVFDFLENNFHLFDEYSLMKGFPKEARNFIETIVDKENGVLLIYTQVNENLICYKYDLN